MKKLGTLLVLMFSFAIFSGCAEQKPAAKPATKTEAPKAGEAPKDATPPASTEKPAEKK